MSPLLAADMPLPDSPAIWEQCQYSMPPAALPSPPPSELSSPALSVAMLKSRLSPDHDLCMPTSQVFEFEDSAYDSSTNHTPPPVPAPASALSPAAAEELLGQAAAAGQQPTKKSRQSTKDFVPPDVSGLSKREARLVKNRAAAFLSRQRKREEFENMEVRVAHLEQENARLQALAGPSPAASEGTNQGLHSEIENLRAQLAAAQAREQQLNSQLAQQTEVPCNIKAEAAEETSFPNSAPLKNLSQAPHRAGPSFGLMVLLCALPTLLSTPTQPTMPTTFSIPTTIPTSFNNSFDFSSFLPNDYDWAPPTHQASFDHDDHSSIPPFTTKKLEFADVDAVSGLAGLDVSFDTSSLPDGKIRVKIHHPSSVSGTQINPGLWMEHSSLGRASSPAHPGVTSSGMDPFLGLGPQQHTPSTHGDYVASASSPGDINYDLNYDLGSEYTIGNHFGVKRRVRIALKSMPATGGEGGEWEVQLC